MMNLLNAYNRLNAAHTYLFGFTYEEVLYTIWLTFEEIASIARVSRASSRKGGYMTIRLRANESCKVNWINTGKAEAFGAASLLIEEGHNKGEVFERLMVERYTARTWAKDSTPFYEAGDMNVNGTEIQIKLNEAELTNERVINTAAALLG